MKGTFATIKCSIQKKNGRKRFCLLLHWGQNPWFTLKPWNFTLCMLIPVLPICWQVTKFAWVAIFAVSKSRGYYYNADQPRNRSNPMALFGTIADHLANWCEIETCFKVCKLCSCGFKKITQKCNLFQLFFPPENNFKIY